MSYLVMARKWRPKNFEEMVGQEHIAQTLRNAIASNRVSHAYLFTGTRGVGKTTAARILAKALNCLNGPTAIPCETCDNCLAVNRGASMDVLEIDGASNNSVDNIRELREQVAYAPMQGGSKIYIIDEVHMLSKAAFNALLKTLEEPPPHVVFIFATTEVGKVPHTILSRVQRFDFKRISEAAIADRLEYICTQEGITPERAALEALARKADGSMRDALSLFDRVYAFAGDSLTLEAARKALGIPAESLFDDLLKHLCAHDAGGCLATLGSVYEDGLEVSEFLTGFGEYLRDLLFSRQPGVTPALLGLAPSRFAELRTLAGDLQDGDILRYAKIISDLIAGLKNSPHPRLWVELGLARMAALDRVVTLSQLMGQDVPNTGSAPISAPAPHAPHVDDPKKKSPELTDTLPPPVEDLPPPHLQPSLEAFEEPDLPGHIQDAASLPESADAEADQETEDMFAVTSPFEPGDDDSRTAPTPISPAEAPARWSDLVEDYALDKPFTSSPLRHSTLHCKPVSGGDTAGLEVAFANEHYHDLFLADADNRKSLRAFFTTRLTPDVSFALTFATAGANAENGTADANGANGGADGGALPSGAMKSHHPTVTTQAVIQNDPIIQTVIEMFEGRVLN
jgi:DNA polymerase III subunit gamma/tau